MYFAADHRARDTGNRAHKQRRLFEAIEDAETGLSKRDVAPRLRELADLRAQKELERDELKAQLTAKPIKLSK